MQEPTVTIIIPAYNEQLAIGDVLTELVREFNGPQYEIIVVDDGSKDDTSQIASRFPVRLLQHKRNRGYGAAIKTGIRGARGGIVAFMDADAQHRVASVQGVLKEMERADFDMVLGVRTGGLQTTLWRAPGKFLIRRLAEYLLREKVPDINTGLRALRRSQALRFLPLCPDGFSLVTTLTLACMCERLAIGYVPIVVSKRRGSSLVRWKDGFRTMFNITALMVLFRPVRVFFPLALGMGFLGAGFGVYGILRIGRVPNTGVVLMIGAVIVFCFAFLAEQVALLRRLLVDFRAEELAREKHGNGGPTASTGREIGRHDKDG